MAQLVKALVNLSFELIIFLHPKLLLKIISYLLKFTLKARKKIFWIII